MSRRISSKCDWCESTIEEGEDEDEFLEKFYGEGWLFVSTGVDDTDGLDFCSAACLLSYYEE